MGAKRKLISVGLGVERGVCVVRLGVKAANDAQKWEKIGLKTGSECV